MNLWYFLIEISQKSLKPLLKWFVMPLNKVTWRKVIYVADEGKISNEKIMPRSVVIQLNSSFGCFLFSHTKIGFLNMFNSIETIITINLSNTYDFISNEGKFIIRIPIIFYDNCI